MYASGRALARFAAQRAGYDETDPTGLLARLQKRGALDGRVVGKLVSRGYPGAVEAAHELSTWLGRGLLGLVNIFNPEMIVVGGGVSDLGELILGPAREYVLQTAMAPNREQVQVVRAILGNEAGLVGGALTAWQVCRSAGD
jgi:glucokinase